MTRFLKKLLLIPPAGSRACVMETQAVSENMLSCIFQQPLEVQSCDARNCTPLCSSGVGETGLLLKHTALHQARLCAQGIPTCFGVCPWACSIVP